jgi:hypothetical protein
VADRLDLGADRVTSVNHGSACLGPLRVALESRRLDVDAADLVIARARETTKDASKIDRADERVASSGAEIDRVRLRIRIRGSVRRAGHGD